MSIHRVIGATVALGLALISLSNDGQTRCDIAGEAVPEHIQDFVDTYAGPTRQLTLRL